MKIRRTFLKGAAVRAFAFGALLLLTPGCAFLARGRCYVAEDRYDRMKKLFIASYSLQQVEQAMDAEGWSRCERNEFRYRLNKDLNLEPSTETEVPGPEILP